MLDIRQTKTQALRKRKMKMTKTYFNIMALAGLLSLMACADEIAPEALTATDDNVITLSLSSEAQTTPTTRAFGTGAHAEQLIYMIYKDKGDGQYEKDTYFLGDNDTYQIDDNTTLRNCGVINDFDPTKQTSIRLIPNPADSKNQKYKIVCWAQEEDSPYFNLTEFPQKITIKYNEENGTLTSTNNTENLDAFYCSTTFTVSDKGTNVPIVLKRPFAQINIGTSGWDYEGFAFIEPQPKIIKYSKMTVTGVATSFNPFDNKCEVPAGGLTTVTFDWTKLPAYRNLNLQDTTIEKSITGIYTTDHRVSEKPDSIGIFIKKNAEEEFLLLKLPRPGSTENKDKDYSDDDNYYSYEPYIGWKKYDGFCATSNSHEELLKNIFTETFKYLSMCYVLVPFEVKVDDDGNETGRTSSTVKLEFDCAVNKPATGQSWEGVLGANTPVLKLNNVPAASNHRTNIVAADGTGFFMNANELKVAVYSETFGEYYKRLDATSDKWEEDNGKDGDRLNEGEGGFNWPDDDIDPEAGKFSPMPKPNITMETRSDDQYFSPEENTIKVFAYINRNKDFDGTKNAGKENISFTVNALNITSDRYDFEFYLGEQKIEVTPNSSGDCTIKKSVTDLTNIIMNNNITKVTDVSDEELQIPYYPITYTVKTVPKSENYKATDDQTVTIKVYPIYEKYTFSFNSDDEGKSIMYGINEKGEDADKDDKYEQGFKSIAGDLVVSNSTSTISVQGRLGNDGKKNGNHRLFAMSDHLKFKGAAKFPEGDDPKITTGIGHYVTLKNLAGNSKITVKIGRDAGQDNSNKKDANTSIVYHDRQLKFQYDNKIDYGETWKALRLPNANVDIANETTTGTSHYLASETKIANGYDVKLSQPGEVKIAMDGSGFCFYWIIVSETNDDMQKNMQNY